MPSTITPLRLLLTSAGSTAAQNLIWELRRSGIPFAIVGTNAEVPSSARDLLDVEAKVPLGSDAHYIDAIMDLVQQHDIQLFVPVMEPELLAASRARDRLDASGLQTILAPEFAIRLARSKRALLERFDELQIPHPDSVSPVDVSGAVFARPDQGTGSHRARRLEPEERASTLQSEPDLVLTETIEAPEFSVDGYADRPGHLVHAIARSRDLVRHGLVVRSTIIEMPAVVRTYVERICTGVSLDGFFNLQYFYHDERGPLFFDLNPRLGGGMALSFAAGLDASTYLQARLGVGVIPTTHRESVGLRLLRRFHNVIVEPDSRK